MNKIVINTDYGGFGISDKAWEWMINNDLEEKYHYDCLKIPRHHPLLIKCINKFGEGFTGSPGASLAITEINSNTYRIVEYDGLESIETPDTIDWVTI